MKARGLIPICFFFIAPIITAGQTVSVRPEFPLQGEPMMITVEGGAAVPDVAKISFDGKSLWFFAYGGKPTAIVGVDLGTKIGAHSVIVKMENGKETEKRISVTERPAIEEPLGIPQKLGGNTPAAAANLVTMLSKENSVISAVRSASKRFWRQGFIYPLDSHVVTDQFGYLRKTGYYTIPHKGVDFRATVGTPVLAMERGIVRLAKTFTVYGKTVAVDHGLGIVSYYMHLSKIKVSSGQLVDRGQVIGLSGESGYAEMPHLHVSLKIDNTSVDPIQFLGLFADGHY